ncbi:LysE family translocator [Orbus sturtevantii]|uniref:LysE family translocator n=1 Tax=Orbus sturtevantii TaxID=3074109 RepID=UPI00370DA79B
MTWDIFLVVATISFFGMVSPGPDFFLVVKNSLSYPRKYALITAFGILMGLLTHMSYCVAGIAVIIKTTPWLFTFLRYVGAAYLIWIGIKALFAKGSATLYVGKGAIQPYISYKKVFIQGYLCNLLNPKATLFFLAIFTQVIDISSSLFDKFLVAAIIFIEAVIWWPMVVIIFQSQLVQRRYAKIQFIIDKLLGVILIVLGVKVALGI